MAARNDITGDLIQSKLNSKAFEDNFDRIFRKKGRSKGYETAKEINLAKPVVTPTQPAEYAEDWQSNERDKAIAQNGNIGYGEEVNGEGKTQE